MSDPLQDTHRARAAPWGPGMVLGGRFRLIAPLGSGAMGEVWRAQHLTLATPVAVKLVDLAAQQDPNESLGRFLQEAQAAARLQNPHVVRILDQGSEGQVAYLAMELLEGESLAARLARRGRLPPAEVAELLRQVAEGLDEAHRSGIVHRDLKPANIFFARSSVGVGAAAATREVAKVLDFGIAKIVDARRDAFVQTQAGQVLGTPAYMSPEQVLGRLVDARSDLWQLGIIAFECLSGALPFHGATLGDLFMKICSAPLPAPSRVAPVTPGVDAWFAQAIARDRDDRFASAAELAQAFQAAAGLAQHASGAWATTTVARQSLARVARKRRTLLIGAAAGVAFAAAALGLLIALAPPRAPAPAAQGGEPAATPAEPPPSPVAAAPPAPPAEPPRAPESAPEPASTAPAGAAPEAPPAGSASPAAPPPAGSARVSPRPQGKGKHYEGKGSVETLGL